MASARPRSTKVPKACDRCKRQKLKCDVERPCLLCTRSGITCTSSGNAYHALEIPAVLKSRTKRKRAHHESTRDQQISNEQSSGYPTSADSSDGDGSKSAKHVRLEGAIRTDNSRSTIRVTASNEHRAAAFAGDTSAITLTKQVFSFNDSSQQSITSALPGGSDRYSITNPELPFFNPYLPPAEVVEVLIDAYFDTVHWSMFLIHEPSFRKQAKQLLALGSRIRNSSDADFAALLMMVIALGAQYGASSPQWTFRHLVAQHSIDLSLLVRTLTRQVRSHLLDLLERCQLEAVQVCVLLGTYYIYHGNPNLSWSVLGLAVKAAYALGMHREVEWKGDFSLLQGRKRAWGHTIIADIFGAVVYGRPATVDRDFCDISYPDECEDTEIPALLRTYIRNINGGQDVSRLSYHFYKYQLYEIKSQIISKIYTLRARASFQASGSGVSKLVKTVQTFDSRLKAWRNNLSPFFGESSWSSATGSAQDVFDGLIDPLSPAEEQVKRHLIQQKVLLQVLYDYILLLLHRPLLEYRMCSGRPSSSTHNPFPTSFDTCVEAALRISHTPTSIFAYNSALPLVTMHMLPAGVILCIPATMDPFSGLAQKARAGVVRMITVFGNLTGQSPVVAQVSTILEELMKVVIKRELETVMALENPRTTENAAGELDHSISSSSLQPTNVVTLSSTLDHPKSHLVDVGEPTPSQFVGPSASYQAMLPPQPPRVASRSDALPQPQYPAVHVALPTLYEDAATSISPETFGSSQPTYDYLDAEPDQGFNVAFEALERVIYDVAPSEWTNPAWMHPYEDAEPFTNVPGQFGDGLLGMDLSGGGDGGGGGGDVG